MSRAGVHTVAFFLAAPGTTAGLVPWWISGGDRPDGAAGGVPDVVGVASVLLGLVAVIACFVRFVTEGSGTPAPTALTEILVVGGLYRYVRNPMYLAVGAMIGGQALLFRSPGVALWLAGFTLLVVAFVKGYEEPALARRFGSSYDAYREAVPGWWPRLTPYAGRPADQPK